MPLVHPRFWLAVGILLVVAIVSGSLAPPEDVESLTVGSDKVAHALAYTALTLWFTGIYPRSRYVLIGFGLFMLGAVIEVVQGAMSWGRQSDFFDLIANSMGIATGLLLAWNWLGDWVQWIETRFRRIPNS